MRLLFCLFFFTNSVIMAQEQLPLAEIPPAPEMANSGNVIARMVQGLGYRYYWASKDLREIDLAYRPTEEASSSFETLEHIYGLAEVIHNTALSQASQRPLANAPKAYNSLRAQTLAHLEEASRLFLEKSAEEVAQKEVIFQRGEKHYRFPIWNLLNGPLADAIYHTGQVVSFRRTTGNPIQSGVNVFMGKTKE